MLYVPFRNFTEIFKVFTKLDFEDNWNFFYEYRERSEHFIYLNCSVVSNFKSGHPIVRPDTTFGSLSLSQFYGPILSYILQINLNCIKN